MQEDQRPGFFSSSAFGSVLIPIGIVALGSLIIWGVSALLMGTRDHNDLLRDLKAKSFGNRWVAAYELAKYIATESVPVEERPQMVADLVSLYETAQEVRLQKFVMMALGGIKHPYAYAALYQGLKNPHADVVLMALIGISGAPKIAEEQQGNLLNLVNHRDAGVRQTLALLLDRIPSEETHQALKVLYRDERRPVRYSAAAALCHYQDPLIEETVKEILTLPLGQASESDDYLFRKNSILNILRALNGIRWETFFPLVKALTQHSDRDISKWAEKVLF